MRNQKLWILASASAPTGGESAAVGVDCTDAGLRSVLLHRISCNRANAKVALGSTKLLDASPAPDGTTPVQFGGGPSVGKLTVVETGQKASGGFNPNVGGGAVASGEWTREFVPPVEIPVGHHLTIVNGTADESMDVELVLEEER